MARPENRSDARALSLTLPTETFNYLVLLATLGKLGRTENEVATHILVREVYAMIERGFHEMRVPMPEGEGGGQRLRLSPRVKPGCEKAMSALVYLFDPEQFDVEDQRSVRRNDTAGALRAVAERRRNDQR